MQFGDAGNRDGKLAVFNYKKNGWGFIEEDDAMNADDDDMDLDDEDLDGDLDEDEFERKK